MTGQIRFDLVPQQGLMELNKVLSLKLRDHPADAWRRDLSWRDALSNLKKHLYEF